MKRLFIAVLAFWAVAACVWGRTATDFFTTAPDAIFRLLPQSTRLDMVDYFNYGSSKASDNYFGGQARIKAISEAVVGLEIDKGVEVQLAVIPAKNDTVIAVVTTLALPVADSSVKFYDTKWKELKKPPFTMPEYEDWLTAEGKKNILEAQAYLPFMPVKAAFAPEGDVLVLVNGAEEYLGGDEAEKFRGWLVPSMTYDVKTSRFTLRK